MKRTILQIGDLSEKQKEQIKPFLAIESQSIKINSVFLPPNYRVILRETSKKEEIITIKKGKLSIEITPRNPMEHFYKIPRNLQELIDRTREVVSEEEALKEVVVKSDTIKGFTLHIRYNNQDTDGTKKWRLIIDGSEYHVQEIILNVPCKTITEEWPEVGVKHHITTTSKKITFKNGMAYVG